MILSAKSLAANETIVVPGAAGMVLPTGGTLQALASAGTAISIMASGTEIV